MMDPDILLFVGLSFPIIIIMMLFGCCKLFRMLSLCFHLKKCDKTKKRLKPETYLQNTQHLNNYTLSLVAQNPLLN